MEFSKKIHSKNERKGNHMAKLKKWIGNLKVAEKLKVYRMAVLVMTAFFVLVALVSTLVIRSNIRHREDHGGLVSGIGISAGIRNNDC